MAEALRAAEDSAASGDDDTADGFLDPLTDGSDGDRQHPADDRYAQVIPFCNFSKPLLQRSREKQGRISVALCVNSHRTTRHQALCFWSNPVHAVQALSELQVDVAVAQALEQA